MNEKAYYTTPEAVALYLGLTISGSDLEDAIPAQWIYAMSEYADQKANRVLYREEPTTILYDGNGQNLLVIKDVLDPVVELDGTVVTTYNYPTTKEYTSRIVLEEGYRFTKGRQNVSVTGVPGLSLYLKDDIQMAVTALVAGLYNNANPEDESQTIASERIGNYQVSFTTKKQLTDYENAQAVLSSYRRIAI